MVKWIKKFRRFGRDDLYDEQITSTKFDQKVQSKLRSNKKILYECTFQLLKSVKIISFTWIEFGGDNLLKNEIISTKFYVKMQPFTHPNGWPLNRGPSSLGVLGLVFFLVGVYVFLYRPGLLREREKKKEYCKYQPFVTH